MTPVPSQTPSIHESGTRSAGVSVGSSIMVSQGYPPGTRKGPDPAERTGPRRGSLLLTPEQAHKNRHRAERDPDACKAEEANKEHLEGEDVDTTKKVEHGSILRRSQLSLKSAGKTDIPEAAAVNSAPTSET